MRFLPAVLVLAALVLASSPLLAQQGDRNPIPSDPIYGAPDPRMAAISGMVRYQENGKLASAVMVKLEKDTGAPVDRAWTGSSGHFQFFRIPRGNYVLVVEAQGFKTVRIPVEYYSPVPSIIISLVPEDKESPNAEGTAVSVRQLNIPKTARKEYEKGMELMSKKQAEDSIGHFRRAIELYPDYDDAYLQLSWVHFQQRRLPEAQQVLEQALQHNNKNAMAYALLGSVQRQQNHLPEAIQDYERSLSLEEASWRAHLELGETLVKLGKVEQAYPHMVRAHQLNPTPASVHLQLYNTLILRSDYQAAVGELEEFLKLYPEHALVPRVRQQRDALLAKLQQPK